MSKRANNMDEAEKAAFEELRQSLEKSKKANFPYRQKYLEAWSIIGLPSVQEFVTKSMSKIVKNNAQREMMIETFCYLTNRMICDYGKGTDILKGCDSVWSEKSEFVAMVGVIDHDRVLESLYNKFMGNVLPMSYESFLQCCIKQRISVVDQCKIIAQSVLDLE